MTFRTMTRQEKYDFMVSEMGITEQGAIAYLTPVGELVEDPTLNMLAHQTHEKITEWQRVRNTEYDKANPKKGIFDELNK